MSAWLKNIIGGPREAHGVETAKAYYSKAKRLLGAHARGRLIESELRLPAYVSAGRWVVDCVCGNGPSASPEWTLAICFECGLVYRPVFPEGREDGEQALLARPVVNRHWFPDPVVAARRGVHRAETVADLARENRENGHPERRR